MISKIHKRKKLKIVILEGGFEPERSASKLTGETIFRGFVEAGYKSVTRLNVSEDIIKQLLAIKPEFAFLSLFCKWGEDGVIQSILEVLGIPYSGSGVEASAICKDKFAFSMFAKGCGMNTPRTELFSRYDQVMENRQLVQYPCVVKPVFQAYSLGMSLVKDELSLKASVIKAFKFSTKIVIQEFIEGREFTVGVLDIPNKGTVVLPITELKLQRSTLDLESREDSTLVETVIPADLSAKDRFVVERDARLLHLYLGCLGVSRFDLRRKTSDGKFYFLEDNTCPGMLSFEHSHLPKQLKAAGISLGQYVDSMVITGLLRKETKIDCDLDCK